jgi:cyclic pyranopterin phosphate synthase
MPADGVSLTRSDRLLSADEMLRLASLFVREGVDKIRLTGGEPTVRPDLVGVVAALDKLRPAGLKQIAMTTNGIALSRLLPELRAAGLDKLNLSLDTLDRSKFERLTRRDALPKVTVLNSARPRARPLPTRRGRQPAAGAACDRRRHRAGLHSAQA